MEYRLAKRSDIDAVYTLIKAAIVQMEADGIVKESTLKELLQRASLLRNLQKHTFTIKLMRKLVF